MADDQRIATPITDQLDEAIDALDALTEVRHALTDLVELGACQRPTGRILTVLVQCLTAKHAEAREAIRLALTAAREAGV